ncbi:ribokinase [Palleronia salina]|uniref:Ribokinase n=1 Tax=Palleronia salina TaxID=313368 RepID=A0A1M6LWH5_9RHOB|nr:carbohydrate kinase family protein [Palleronia salina]SHJ75483.1 ribokinase [Palleronia salina]
MTDVSGAPRLLCVGDMDMDIILRVPKPPGPDQKVDGERVLQCPGGMAANVAVAARRLGTTTRLLAALGDDAMGAEARAALEREHLDLDHLAVRPGAATFFCVIMVDDRGEKSLVKALSPAYLPRPDDLTPKAFEGIAHLHMTFTRHDLALRAIELARAAGATVSLDLEAADLDSSGGSVRALVEAVDLLFLSAQSRPAVEAAIGPVGDRADLTVVTTMGDAGARVERGGREVARLPGHTVPVTDTSGAGDAFAGAFLTARLDGADDASALRFANAAAALSVRAYGAQTGLPDRSEVGAFLDARTPKDTHA